MWYLSGAEINIAVRDAINTMNKTYRDVMGVPKNKRTFDNTLSVLSAAYGALCSVTNRATFMRFVHPDEKVRDAAQIADIKLENYFAEIETRSDIYEFICSVRAQFYGDLNAEDARYADFMVKSFVQAGAHIKDAPAIREIKKLKKNINRLSAQFQSNINSDGVVQLEDSELAGMPDYILSDMKKSKGVYSIPLTLEMVSQILAFSDAEETRKKVSKAYKLKAAGNVSILFDLTKARRKYAELLGYKSYAEYILGSRMAGQPHTVAIFLEELRQVLEKSYLEEIKVMRADKKSDICVWDINYYEAKNMRAQLVGKQVGEYFYMEHVLDTAIKKMCELFGVKIAARDPPYEMWHRDISEYLVMSNAGELLGIFALDLFARANKSNHFACFSITDRINKNDKVVVPAYCVLLGNFANSRGGRPPLLQFDDVQTLYHELGHVMHNILGGAAHSVFSGTRVELDFVEMPSQLLENLCWEPDTIKALSKHWRTGLELSDEDIKKLISARTFSAIKYYTQVGMAAVDQLLHGERDFDTVENMVSEIMKLEVQHGIIGNDICESSIFEHLTLEYAASYYGYLWSEIYAHDLYDSMENLQQWKRYTELILSQGGALGAFEMLRKFLGRDPSIDAFKKHIDGK